MRNSTLAIAGIATCTIGLLGGMAAHPTMKGPSWPDWRERYRAFTSSVPEVDYPVYQVAEAGYRYDLAAAGLAPPSAIEPVPAIEAEPDPAPLEEPAWTVPAEAPHDPEPGSGAQVVQVSLAQTDGIGAATAQVTVDPAPPLAPNGVGNPDMGD